MNLARKDDDVLDAMNETGPDMTPDTSAAPGFDEVIVQRSKSSDAFRTIGEAAAELGLKTHVLRFWETKFTDLKPMKRPDGRRYYRVEDMQLLRALQQLLHVQGLTIRGAVKALAEHGPDLSLAQAAAILSDEAAGEVAADLDIVEAGASVRDLQNAVRDAVERGDFAVPAEEAASIARQRLESLLADLSGLKSRLDKVRTAA